MRHDASMTIKVILLFVLAIVPFAIFVRWPESRYYRLFPGAGLVFFFTTGLTWCAFFGFTCWRASPRARRRLLLLLPLALFAFVVPGYVTYLFVGFFVAMAIGRAPP